MFVTDAPLEKTISSRRPVQLPFPLLDKTANDGTSGFLAMCTNDQLYSRRPLSFVGENEHAVDFALVFTGVINFTVTLVHFVPVFVGDNGPTVKLMIF